jgi:hypothetical protein
MSSVSSLQRTSTFQGFKPPLLPRHPQASQFRASSVFHFSYFQISNRMTPHTHRKGRKHNHHHRMDSTTLREALAALASVPEDQYEAALTQVLADFDAFVAALPTASAPTADPIATVVVTTKSGVVTNCIPQS